MENSNSKQQVAMNMSMSEFPIALLIKQSLRSVVFDETNMGILSAKCSGTLLRSPGDLKQLYQNPWEYAEKLISNDEISAADTSAKHRILYTFLKELRDARPPQAMRWTKFQHYMFFVYRHAISPRPIASSGCLPVYLTKTMHELVVSLSEEDKTQFYVRLVTLLREYVTVAAVNFEVIPSFAEPTTFLICLLSYYSAFCSAAGKLVAVMTDFEEFTNERFHVSWNCLNQRIFYQYFFLSNAVKEKMPTFHNLLRENKPNYQKLLESYQCFMANMVSLDAHWQRQRKRITVLSERNLKTEPNWIQRDWKMFEEITKIMKTNFWIIRNSDSKSVQDMEELDGHVLALVGDRWNVANRLVTPAGNCICEDCMTAEYCHYLLPSLSAKPGITKTAVAVTDYDAKPDGSFFNCNNFALGPNNNNNYHQEKMIDIPVTIYKQVTSCLGEAAFRKLSSISSPSSLTPVPQVNPTKTRQFNNTNSIQSDATENDSNTTENDTNTIEIDTNTTENFANTTENDSNTQTSVPNTQAGVTDSQSSVPLINAKCSHKNDSNNVPEVDKNGPIVPIKTVSQINSKSVLKSNITCQALNSAGESNNSQNNGGLPEFHITAPQKNVSVASVSSLTQSHTSLPKTVLSTGTDTNLVTDNLSELTSKVHRFASLLDGICSDVALIRKETTQTSPSLSRITKPRYTDRLMMCYICCKAVPLDGLVTHLLYSHTVDNNSIGSIVSDDVANNSAIVSDDVANNSTSVNEDNKTDATVNKVGTIDKKPVAICSKVKVVFKTTGKSCATVEVGAIDTHVHESVATAAKVQIGTTGVTMKDVTTGTIVNKTVKTGSNISKVIETIANVISSETVNATSAKATGATFNPCANIKSIATVKTIQDVTADDSSSISNDIDTEISTRKVIPTDVVTGATVNKSTGTTIIDDITGEIKTIKVVPPGSIVKDVISGATVQVFPTGWIVRDVATGEIVRSGQNAAISTAAETSTGAINKCDFSRIYTDPNCDNSATSGNTGTNLCTIRKRKDANKFGKMVATCVDSSPNKAKLDIDTSLYNTRLTNTNSNNSNTNCNSKEAITRSYNSNINSGNDKSSGHNENVSSTDSGLLELSDRMARLSTTNPFETAKVFSTGKSVFSCPTTPGISTLPGKYDRRGGGHCRYESSPFFMDSELFPRENTMAGLLGKNAGTTSQNSAKNTVGQSTFTFMGSPEKKLKSPETTVSFTTKNGVTVMTKSVPLTSDVQGRNLRPTITRTRPVKSAKMANSSTNLSVNMDTLHAKLAELNCGDCQQRSSSAMATTTVGDLRIVGNGEADLDRTVTTKIMKKPPDKRTVLKTEAKAIECSKGSDENDDISKAPLEPFIGPRIEEEEEIERAARAALLTNTMPHVCDNINTDRRCDCPYCVFFGPCTSTDTNPKLVTTRERLRTRLYHRRESRRIAHLESATFTPSCGPQTLKNKKVKYHGGKGACANEPSTVCLEVQIDEPEYDVPNLPDEIPVVTIVCDACLAARTNIEGGRKYTVSDMNAAVQQYNREVRNARRRQFCTTHPPAPFNDEDDEDDQVRSLYDLETCCTSQSNSRKRKARRRKLATANQSATAHDVVTTDATTVEDQASSGDDSASSPPEVITYNVEPSAKKNIRGRRVGFVSDTSSIVGGSLHNATNLGQRRGGTITSTAGKIKQLAAGAINAICNASSAALAAATSSTRSNTNNNTDSSALRFDSCFNHDVTITSLSNTDSGGSTTLTANDTISSNDEHAGICKHQFVPVQSAEVKDGDDCSDSMYDRLVEIGEDEFDLSGLIFGDTNHIHEEANNCCSDLCQLSLEDETTLLDTVNNAKKNSEDCVSGDIDLACVQGPRDGEGGCVGNKSDWPASDDDEVFSRVASTVRSRQTKLPKVRRSSHRGNPCLPLRSRDDITETGQTTAKSIGAIRTTGNSCRTSGPCSQASSHVDRTTTTCCEGRSVPSISLGTTAISAIRTAVNTVKSTTNAVQMSTANQFTSPNDSRAVSISRGRTVSSVPDFTDDIDAVMNYIEGDSSLVRQSQVLKKAEKKARQREKREEERRLEEEARVMEQERMRIQLEIQLEVARVAEEADNRRLEAEAAAALTREMAAQSKARKSKMARKKGTTNAKKDDKKNARNQPSFSNNTLVPAYNTILEQTQPNAEEFTEEETIPAMVTIRRVPEQINFPPMVTITLKGHTPDQDQLLYTLVNGQSEHIDQALLQSVVGGTNVATGIATVTATATARYTVTRIDGGGQQGKENRQGHMEAERQEQSTTNNKPVLYDTQSVIALADIDTEPDFEQPALTKKQRRKLRIEEEKRRDEDTVHKQAKNDGKSSKNIQQTNEVNNASTNESVISFVQQAARNSAEMTSCAGSSEVKSGASSVKWGNVDSGGGKSKKKQKSLANANKPIVRTKINENTSGVVIFAENKKEELAIKPPTKGQHNPPKNRSEKKITKKEAATAAILEKLAKKKREEGTKHTKPEHIPTQKQQKTAKPPCNKNTQQRQQQSQPHDTTDFGIKLPPGITITKVTGPPLPRKSFSQIPQSSTITSIPTTSSKYQRPPQSTTLAQSQQDYSSVNKSGVIVIDTEELIKQKAKHNDDNQKHQAAHTTDMVIQTKAKGGIVCLRNPNFPPGNADAATTSNVVAGGDHLNEQATIVHGEGGIVTIRRPHMMLMPQQPTQQDIVNYSRLDSDGFHRASDSVIVNSDASVHNDKHCDVNTSSDYSDCKGDSDVNTKTCGHDNQDINQYEDARDLFGNDHDQTVGEGQLATVYYVNSEDQVDCKGSNSSSSDYQTATFVGDQQVATTTHTNYQPVLATTSMDYHQTSTANNKTVIMDHYKQVPAPITADYSITGITASGDYLTKVDYSATTKDSYRTATCMNDRKASSTLNTYREPSPTITYQSTSPITSNNLTIANTSCQYSSPTIDYITTNINTSENIPPATIPLGHSCVTAPIPLPPVDYSTVITDQHQRGTPSTSMTDIVGISSKSAVTEVQRRASKVRTDHRRPSMTTITDQPGSPSLAVTDKQRRPSAFVTDQRRASSVTISDQRGSSSFTDIQRGPSSMVITDQRRDSSAISTDQRPCSIAITNQPVSSAMAISEIQPVVMTDQRSVSSAIAITDVQPESSSTNITDLLDTSSTTMNDRLDTSSTTMTDLAAHHSMTLTDQRGPSSAVVINQRGADYLSSTIDFPRTATQQRAPGSDAIEYTTAQTHNSFALGFIPQHEPNTHERTHISRISPPLQPISPPNRTPNTSVYTPPYSTSLIPLQHDINASNASHHHQQQLEFTPQINTQQHTTDQLTVQLGDELTAQIAAQFTEQQITKQKLTLKLRQQIHQQNMTELQYAQKELTQQALHITQAQQAVEQQQLNEQLQHLALTPKPSASFGNHFCGTPKIVTPKEQQDRVSDYVRRQQAVQVHGQSVISESRQSDVMYSRHLVDIDPMLNIHHTQHSMLWGLPGIEVTTVSTDDLIGTSPLQNVGVIGQARLTAGPTVAAAASAASTAAFETAHATFVQNTDEMVFDDGMRAGTSGVIGTGRVATAMPMPQQHVYHGHGHGPDQSLGIRHVNNTSNILTGDNNGQQSSGSNVNGQRQPNNGQGPNQGGGDWQPYGFWPSS